MVFLYCVVSEYIDTIDMVGTGKSNIDRDHPANQMIDLTGQL